MTADGTDGSIIKTVLRIVTCGCYARSEPPSPSDAHGQGNGWTDDEAEPQPVDDEEYESWATATTYHPDDAHAWEAFTAKYQPTSENKGDRSRA
ncbi:hypothetical protein psal_cds_849 [Pandoravirus salinus]|uniref:Uncharacterized protein n=1 Tax=Pandoravirus salinus TaxID=1349410 RepID=A0A291ATX2_9VIRU|nr:hypothetical protein psal_cds_849 [Pandoravirus salinus]ATE82239.1 hypothetical protein psal_cds_849 [Pandoravirus salinus]